MIEAAGQSHCRYAGSICSTIQQRAKRVHAAMPSLTLQMSFSTETEERGVMSVWFDVPMAGIRTVTIVPRSICNRILIHYSLHGVGTNSVVL